MPVPHEGVPIKQSGLSPEACLPRTSLSDFSGRSRALSRWRAKVPGSDDEPVGGSVVVVSGSLRSPGEADALSVQLGIWDTEITMSTGGTELGSWPSTAVEIRSIGSTAFEFIAEGDRLIFTPDDPATFGNSPIVVGQGAGTGSRKRRTSKKKPDGSGPSLARDQASPKKERSPRRRRAQESLQEKPSKPSRPHHTATVESASGEAAHAREVPAPPSAVPGAFDATLDDGQRVADAAGTGGRRPRKAQHASPPGVPELDDALALESKKERKGVWIRALDMARTYDTFGLDRVPVDESLRGHEHQHTWDHRVAATSGLGKHICTICGAIRR